MRRLNHSFVLFISAARVIWTVEPFSTVPFDVTTMAAVNGTYTTDDWQCSCDCTDMEAAMNRSSDVPSTQMEAEAAANRLTQELTMDKSNLSSTTRRKNSAPDSRPSAQGLGVVGVIVIVLVLGTVVALDLSVLYRDLRVAVCRLFGLNMPEGWHLVRRRANYAKRGRGFGRGMGVTDGGGGGGGRKASSHHAIASPQPGPRPPPAAHIYRHEDADSISNNNNNYNFNISGAEHFGGAALPRPGVDDTAAEAENPPSGAGAVKALAHTPSSISVTVSGMPPDIKSRRELLLMHGASQ